MIYYIITLYYFVITGSLFQSLFCILFAEVSRAVWYTWYIHAVMCVLVYRVCQAWCWSQWKSLTCLQWTPASVPLPHSYHLITGCLYDCRPCLCSTTSKWTSVPTSDTYVPHSELDWYQGTVWPADWSCFDSCRFSVYNSRSHWMALKWSLVCHSLSW